MITKEQIQFKITEAIKLSGMSHKELAEKLNVTRSCISHYVIGDIMPSLDTFANLCAVLDVEPADILCLKD